MTIAFNSIPSNILDPGVLVEVEAGRALAGLILQPYRILVTGQMLGTGTADALEPKLVTSLQHARTLFGEGSMLAGMAEGLFAAQTTVETWFIGLEDPDGAAAEGELEFTAVTPAAGTVHVYVGGRHYQVPVTTSSTATTLGAALAALVTADVHAPFTAAADTGTVTFTSRHEGTLPNDLDIRVNHEQDQFLPSGVTVDITPFAGGSGVPDVADIWAALGEEQFQIIVYPWRDASALTAVEAELEDRWGPLRMIAGAAISAAPGDAAALVALGDSRNSPFLSIVGTNASPTPTWEYAAAVAGVVAFHAEIDPARPLQALRVPHVLAPRITARFTAAERNIVLGNGIALTKVVPGGEVHLVRMVTTRTENALGTPDPTFRDLETVLTLGFLRGDFRSYWASKYARHKLVETGTRVGEGQAVVTPAIAKAEAVARFRQWEERGLVENFAAFKAGVVAQRNASDPNRLDILLTPDLANQLRVTGVQIAFIL